jgi:hypothetical protein
MQVLPKEQRALVFLKRAIFVPQKSRCCSYHLYKGELTYEALRLIERVQFTQLTFTGSEVKDLFEDCQSVFARVKSFDFDDPSSLDDQSYKTMTGLDHGTVAYPGEKATLGNDCIRFVYGFLVVF